MAAIIIEQQGYELFYEAMLSILISHSKKNNLEPPTHLDDLFKSIGKTALSSKKCFFAFKIILYDEDFSENVKNLFKVKENDNQMTKNIASIKNMIEILFMNINGLCTKRMG